ncbi:hypothetical protein FB480_101660 [Agrobacterium vitis]|nr:hypothetical protein FB480_101660 [Agrobacterium vitis]
MLAVFLIFAAISALFIEVFVDCLDDHRKETLFHKAH